VVKLPTIGALKVLMPPIVWLVVFSTLFVVAAETEFAAAVALAADAVALVADAVALVADAVALAVAAVACAVASTCCADAKIAKLYEFTADACDAVALAADAVALAAAAATAVSISARLYKSASPELFMYNSLLLRDWGGILWLPEKLSGNCIRVEKVVSTASKPVSIRSS
jgi:hypothetical protein